jgi:hypothetical protein
MQQFVALVFFVATSTKKKGNINKFATITFFASSKFFFKMGDNNKLVVVTLFTSTTMKEKNATITNLLSSPIFA